jgi:type IV pilus assembly protein PilN
VVWPAAADDLDPGGRNAFLKTEIAQLDVKIKDIADLKAEIEALKARQNAVENLQTDRNVPVYLLNELVKQTPEGVYLTTVRQLGTVVTLTGKAETNERVSEFLRNTFTTRPGSSGPNWWKSRQRPIRQDAGPLAGCSTSP